MPLLNQYSLTKLIKSSENVLLCYEIKKSVNKKKLLLKQQMVFHYMNLFYLNSPFLSGLYSQDLISLICFKYSNEDMKDSFLPLLSYVA